MKIRPYQAGDEAQLISLWQELGLTTPQNNPQQDIARKLAVAPDLFLVGVQNKQVIASVMGGYEGHRGWVNYLAVANDHQPLGAGRAMMSAIESLLSDRGCPKINLQIRSSNSKVIEFYRSLGYCTDDVVSMGKRILTD